MLVRLLRLTSDPAKRQDQIDVIMNSVIPESREQRGWMGGLLLTQPEGGVAISGSFWASVEALEESEVGGHYRRQLDKFHGLWTAPPDREVLRVAGHRFQNLEQARVARVTTLPIRLGTERDVEAIFRDAVIPELLTEEGFCGTMLLPRPVKSITMTFFNDWAHIDGAEAHTFYQEQVAKMLPFLSGDFVREHFEVTMLELLTPVRAS